MIQTKRFDLAPLLAVALLPLASLNAWEPSGADLDQAIVDGDFSTYLDRATA